MEKKARKPNSPSNDTKKHGNDAGSGSGSRTSSPVKSATESTEFVEVSPANDLTMEDTANNISNLQKNQIEIEDSTVDFEQRKKSANSGENNDKLESNLLSEAILPTNLEDLLAIFLGPNQIDELKKSLVIKASNANLEKVPTNINSKSSLAANSAQILHGSAMSAMGSVPLDESEKNLAEQNLKMKNTKPDNGKTVSFAHHDVNSALIPHGSAAISMGTVSDSGKNLVDQSLNAIPQPTVLEKNAANSNLNKETYAAKVKSNRKLDENVFTLRKHTADAPEIIDDRLCYTLPSYILGEHKLEVLSLVGFFPGKFPGKKEVHNLVSSWKVPSHLHFHNSGWIIFNFDLEDDLQKVLIEGPYKIFGVRLVLKKMPTLFNFSKAEYSKVPVWVQLPNLPYSCWNEEALSWICSLIGTPLHTDTFMAQDDESVSFARAYVEVDISKPITKVLDIKFPDVGKITQFFLYEDLPQWCSKCSRLGHIDEICKGQLHDIPEVYKPKPKPASNAQGFNSKPNQKGTTANQKGSNASQNRANANQNRPNANQNRTNANQNHSNAKSFGNGAKGKNQMYVPVQDKNSQPSKNGHEQFIKPISGGDVLNLASIPVDATEDIQRALHLVYGPGGKGLLFNALNQLQKASLGISQVDLNQENFKATVVNYVAPGRVSVQDNVGPSTSFNNINDDPANNLTSTNAFNSLINEKGDGTSTWAYEVEKNEEESAKTSKRNRSSSRTRGRSSTRKKEVADQATGNNTLSSTGGGKPPLDTKK